MIQLRYLSHSAFEIKCGDTCIISDAWFDGPAYYGQWHLWPLPVKNYKSLKPNAILISHGHEDHLHIQTLKHFDRSTQIFFPFQWRAGVKEYLNHLGFENIVEAVSFKTYHINDVKVTYISFSLESLLVIEYKNEVLVNINDALNSNHENAVDFILKELQKRWPKIDYLLSGWSGASYFPNQVRYPGKNDVEIAKLREQYFANNFCKFTQILQPKYSIPFASGFVLLKKENQWINHVKFPRHKVEAYYKEHFDKDTKIQFIVPYPEDEIQLGQLNKMSALHQITEEEQYQLAYQHYASEIVKANAVASLSDKELQDLIAQLNYWMNFNKKIYHPKVIADIHFSIQLEELNKACYINVTSENGRLKASEADTPLKDRRLLITTSAKKMAYALSKTWGGDVLTIGYGLVIDVYDELSLEKNLDIVCVRLITRYPMARHDIFKYPIRALKFYTYNPQLTSLWLKQKIALKPYVNKYPYNERDHWLTYNRCDLCAVCKMPEIDLNAYA